ncbi:T9SS sorting signal type C domain-containing protein [Flavobacterium hydrophilum]|uniref:Uncharacterized protein n=1 Tax=Flavobacterium hydrophilum TaxID=2211445 RepID=A0A2V4BZY7_9FLAO|nr:T9SS sorting signal type C domain-containing protein [Flavobacterium hydrophilum]PXY44192.1 hypothetical protein DMB68_17315 [Flavobacterium hydrophilum]
MEKNYSKLFLSKNKRAIKGLSIFALLFIGTQTSWGQQPIGTGQFDGGFEGAVLHTAALTQTTPDATKWAYDSGNLSTSAIVDDASKARSGSKSVAFNFIGTTAGKYIMSPQLSPALVGGDGISIVGSSYTVQYFVKTANLANIKGALYVSGRTSSITTTGAVDANGWAKITYTYLPAATNFTPAANKTWAGFGNNVNSNFTGSVDDFVVYQGAVDITAPASASTPVVSGLNVSWTASADVDGGGYVVVRYSTNPNADNDPNQNGVYAVNNIITNGTGSLSGTVVYVGTATSFTDAVAGSVSGSDYYKIYTVDKAFNFSDEIVASALLKVNSVAFNDDSVTIYKNNEAFYVNSGEGVINNIKVFDVQGKLIAEQKDVNSNSAAIKNIHKTNQLLIVKISSEDNKVVTKKIIN